MLEAIPARIRSNGDRWVSIHKCLIAGAVVGSRHPVRHWFHRFHRAGRSWRQPLATQSRAPRVDDKKFPLNQGLVSQQEVSSPFFMMQS